MTDAKKDAGSTAKDELSWRDVLKGKTVRIAASAVFTAIIVALVFRYLSMETLLKALSRLDIWLAFFAVNVYLAVTAVRAFRFVVAGARLPFATMFKIAAVHAALLRVMPLRSGELAYGLMLKRHGGGGFTEGIAAILMLRVLDLATILPLATAIAVAWISGSDGGWSTLGLLAACVALLIFFFSLGPLSRKLATKIAQGSESGWLGKVGRTVQTLAEAYSMPFSKRLALLGITVLMWGLVLLWFHLTLLSIGAVGGMEEGLTVSVLGVTGSILPVSLVGSFGPMEGGFALGLAAIGHGHDVAAAESIVASAVTFATNWIVALPAWILMAMPLWRENKRFENGRVAPVTFAERRPRRLASFGRDAIFCAMGALVMLFRFRYSFERGDQLQYLLHPYKSIYQSFIPGDWFTWQTTHYHEAFSWLIRGLHGVFGVEGLPYAVFAVHFFVLFALAWGLLNIARGMGLGVKAAAIGLIIVTFGFFRGVAGALVTHGSLLPADIALPLFLLGCAAWLQRDHLRSGLWLGAAGLFHANYAVLAPILIGVAELYRISRNKSWRGTMLLSAGFLLIAWPTLITVLRGFFLMDTVPEAIATMFQVRSPHHYLPKLGTSIDIGRILILFAAGLPVWISPARCVPSRAKTLLLVLFASQIVAAIATILEVHTVIRLFLWRASVPLMILLAIAAGRSLIEMFQSREQERLAFACGVVMMLLSVSAKGKISLWPEQYFVGSGWLIPAVIPLAGAAILIARSTAVILRRAALGLVTLVLVWGFLVTIPDLIAAPKQNMSWGQAIGGLLKFHSVNIEPARLPPLKKSALRKKKLHSRSQLYSWIRKFTPTDAVFLIPPGYHDFRMRTHRAVFVDWKCCPMKGEEIAEWRRRMLAATGVKKLKLVGYSLPNSSSRLFWRRSLRDLARLAEAEQLTHVITRNLRGDRKAGLKKLMATKQLAVYRVKK